MKRLLIVALLVLALGLMLVSTSLAYDRVIGCVVDANGDPWTHGGTVVATQDATGIVVGTGVVEADGCFSVFIGNGPAVTATITLDSPDPNDDVVLVCSVPTDTDYQPIPWDCGGGDAGGGPPLNTGTGPNVITLSGIDASSNASLLPAALATLVAGAAIGGFVVWRRKQAAV
jgi:hypothetical protein